MRKYEYRCKKCMIIEQVWSHHSGEPSKCVPCHKCGGQAFRIPSTDAADDDSGDCRAGKFLCN